MDIAITLSLFAFVPVAFLWMWVAKLAFDVIDGSADHAIEEDSNLAVGLQRAGLYLAIPLGLYGALTGPSVGLRADLLALAVDGAVLIGLLLISAWINDKILLRGIDNREAVHKGNTAVAVVEMGAFVATGLIAWGAFSGTGGGVAAAAAFFGIGWLALLIMSVLYEAMTPFNVLEEVRDGNLAAALMIAGMVVALGIVLSASVSGEFTSWARDLASAGLYAALGIAILLALYWPIDWLFLPNTDFRTEIERDRNVAAVSVAASVHIAAALVITAIFV